MKKPCLAHFQPDKQLTVAADASEYGIGAVLSHKNEDGTETPIAYASKTLTKAQKVYPQVEKEALSLVYAVNKFHQYLYGRKFHLITDHKPLLAIFNPDSSIPQRTAQRLQRWALLLSNYNYAIHFRRTNLHANADALSRLPIGPDEDFDSQQEMVFQFDQVAGTAVQQFPLDAWKIAKETRRDNILRKVKEFIQVGWPTSRKSIKDKWLLPYFDKKESLSINQGVILLATENEDCRVVIPQKLKAQVLKLLHRGHWGIVRMKQLARRYCYWLNIDKDIADMVHNCQLCAQYQAAPLKSFLHGRK